MRTTGEANLSIRKGINSLGPLINHHAWAEKKNYTTARTVARCSIPEKAVIRSAEDLESECRRPPQSSPQTSNDLPDPTAIDTAAQKKPELEQNANTTPATPTKPVFSTQDARLARFAALKSRATASARSNLAEAKAEAARASVDPTALQSLSRRAAVASHNILKEDTEELGGQGAFERKRAWDYTIEESEKWDERMARKREARENNVFADYSAEAGKIYERQIRELEKQELKDGGRNREEYERQKDALIERAAQSGDLEIVELDDGELVAIDNNGTFYSNTESVGFVENRPKKENIDRLVNDLRKAEEVRLRKRRNG